MKQKRRKSQKKPKKGLESLTILLTRGIEVFAVLSSLLWAIEATAGLEASEIREAPKSELKRSLSSLAIPNKKSSVNVEFQYSHLKRGFQNQFQALPPTLMPDNTSALSFKQSPFFVQTQFEFFRFPTFFKK